jgi:hypothetical protein
MKFSSQPLSTRNWLTYELAAIVTGHSVEEVAHAVQHCGVSHKSNLIGLTEYKMVDKSEIIAHFCVEPEPAYE